MILSHFRSPVFFHYSRFRQAKQEEKKGCNHDRGDGRFNGSLGNTMAYAVSPIWGGVLGGICHGRSFSWPRLIWPWGSRWVGKTGRFLRHVRMYEVGGAGCYLPSVRLTFYSPKVRISLRAAVDSTTLGDARSGAQRLWRPKGIISHVARTQTATHENNFARRTYLRSLTRGPERRLGEIPGLVSGLPGDLYHRVFCPLGPATG